MFQSPEIDLNMGFLQRRFCFVASMEAGKWYYRTASISLFPPSHPITVAEVFLPHSENLEIPSLNRSILKAEGKEILKTPRTGATYLYSTSFALFDHSYPLAVFVTNLPLNPLPSFLPLHSYINTTATPPLPTHTPNALTCCIE